MASRIPDPQKPDEVLVHPENNAVATADPVPIRTARQKILHDCSRLRMGLNVLQRLEDLHRESLRGVRVAFFQVCIG